MQVLQYGKLPRSCRCFDHQNRVAVAWRAKNEDMAKSPSTNNDRKTALLSDLGMHRND